MNKRQEIRYIKKRIADIEGAISVHQSDIDWENDPTSENTKHRLGAISELLIDLEAFRCYLLHIIKTKENEDM